MGDGNEYDETGGKTKKKITKRGRKKLKSRENKKMEEEQKEKKRR